MAKRKRANNDLQNVPLLGKQFVFRMWHPSWYSCYKPGDKSWMRKGVDSYYDKKKPYPWSLLWHRYSVSIKFAHPLIFCVVFYWPLYVFLPMYCLSFELTFLIIPLVFSTFPCNYINKTITLNNIIQ